MISDLHNQIGDASTEDIYKEHILDHYRDPRNRGRFEPHDLAHREINASCGDDLEVFVALDAERRIARLTFEGRGCAISQAAASMLTEDVVGKRVEDVMKMGKDDIFKLLGITVGPSRIRCALLGLKTVQNGLKKIV